MELSSLFNDTRKYVKMYVMMCIALYTKRKWLSKHPLVLLHVDIMQRLIFCPTVMWIIKKFLFDTAIKIKFIKLHKVVICIN